MGTAAVQDPKIPAVAADGSLYPIGKMAAHRQGVLHLAVSIFVTCRGRLLIQRRALSKYHCGGLWANTCCSHPHWRETAADAARRRLAEELGITGVTLTPMGELAYRADVGGGLVEHEHVHLFHGAAPDALTLDPDPEEVSDTRWIGVEELRGELGSDASRFAPWFRIYADRRPDLMG
ncbi:isopentenyl-diphosphate Delta-isomerase [Thalassobaculum salexigens]|uniref:isopentenyl-diphosphate Delta-isomerase n=1 Tax=Thalassobaculum salexigens TaxID=455360 RepID=UPI00248F3302|nr:isopentenyl-diphosphate Delta-isomerase [Thalassobaculum salexigens]